jgi:hypothetical protein
VAISLTHAFTSGKADGSDPTLVQPSNWNEEHEATMASSRFLGRKSASTGTVEELTADDAYDLLGIVGTTAMLFRQSSAPTGWTKSVTHDDKALRVVSGSVSNGGATAFSSVFGSGKTSGSHTLTQANLPSYNLSVTDTRTFQFSHRDPTDAQGGLQSGGSTAAADDANVTVTIDMASPASGSVVAASGGSGTAHSHTLSLDLHYVDVIIATKD